MPIRHRRVPLPPGYGEGRPRSGLEARPWAKPSTGPGRRFPAHADLQQRLSRRGNSGSAARAQLTDKLAIQLPRHPFHEPGETRPAIRGEAVFGDPNALIGHRLAP